MHNSEALIVEVCMMCMLHCLSSECVGRVTVFLLKIWHENIRLFQLFSKGCQIIRRAKGFEEAWYVDVGVCDA